MYVRFKKWSKGFKIRKCSCKYRAVLHTYLVVYYSFFVTAQTFKINDGYLYFCSWR